MSESQKGPGICDVISAKRYHWVHLDKKCKNQRQSVVQRKELSIEIDTVAQ